MLTRALAFLAAHPRWTALIAGGVSATGFAPLGLWPLTLIALALLLWLLENARSRSGAFLLGWLWGVGHFAIGLNWIATAFTYQAAMPAWLGWVAVVLLSLYLAVFPGLATLAAWWGVSLLKPLPTWGGAARLNERSEFGRSGVGTPDSTALEETPHPNPSPRGEGLSRLPLLLLLFAAAWIITEWLRSWVFTGFAWNPLNAVAIDAVLIDVSNQTLPYIGTYGASALVVFFSLYVLLLFPQLDELPEPVAGDVYSAIKSAGSRAWRWARELRYSFDSKSPDQWLILPLIPMVAIPLWMFSTLFWTIGTSAPGGGWYLGPSDGTAVTIVQPNIQQGDKWDPATRVENFRRLARQSIREPDAEPRLLLWPEAAVPDYLEDGYPPDWYLEPASFTRARLASLLGPDDLLLTGAVKLDPTADGRDVAYARNSLFVLDAQRRVRGRYDKAHLVPYGEYLPARVILEPLGLSRLAPGATDFRHGPGPRTLDLGDFGSVGVQICYEIIFSGNVVDRANRPDFIFNPSNDAWFGAWGPPQHLAQARLRAIEEGLPVVRSTPTGISAIIAPDGRILDSIPMGQAGRIDARLPLPREPTLFARYGNILPLGFAVFLALVGIALGRRRG